MRLHSSIQSRILSLSLPITYIYTLDNIHIYSCQQALSIFLKASIYKEYTMPMQEHSALRRMPYACV